MNVTDVNTALPQTFPPDVTYIFADLLSIGEFCCVSLHILTKVNVWLYLTEADIVGEMERGATEPYAVSSIFLELFFFFLGGIHFFVLNSANLYINDITTFSWP